MIWKLLTPLALAEGGTGAGKICAAEYYQTELDEQSKYPHFVYNPDLDND